MQAREDLSADWLREHLRCPYDGALLSGDGDRLACARGHVFPVVRGIPVLLRGDVSSTHPQWWTQPKHIAALELGAGDRVLAPGEIDPFVRRTSVATCGLLYRGLRDPLPRYPIASLDQLPPGEGRALLDVGGNWGRWALGAAARGYRAVVADPSLRAAVAGRRIARQLGLDVHYVVADGRYLPFGDGAFDVSFSYSVLQSLDKADARRVLSEMSRATARGGVLRVQMANVLGVRRFTKTLAEVASGFVRARLDPRHEPWAFRVRAWTPREIVRVFEELVGPTRLSVDGFFTLNAQRADVDLLRRRYAAIVHASLAMTSAARVLPPLRYVADSLWAEARNERGGAVSAAAS